MGEDWYSVVSIIVCESNEQIIDRGETYTLTFLVPDTDGEVTT